MDGDLAPSLEDGANLGGAKFSKRISILTPKIYDDVFSHRNYFVCFFCLSLLSEIGYITYMTQEPRFQNNTFLLDTFFSQFVLCLTSNNSTSQNIVGTDTWVVHQPQILGGPFPKPPKSPPVVL